MQEIVNQLQFKILKKNKLFQTYFKKQINYFMRIYNSRLERVITKRYKERFWLISYKY